MALAMFRVLPSSVLLNFNKKGVSSVSKEAYETTNAPEREYVVMDNTGAEADHLAFGRGRFDPSTY